jgi:hypothetical protein
VTTLSRRNGQPAPFHVVVPRPDGQPGGAVPDRSANRLERRSVISKRGGRGPSLLLFRTEDGTVCGWNPDVDAQVAVVAADHACVRRHLQGTGARSSQTDGGMLVARALRRAENS